MAVLSATAVWMTPYGTERTSTIASSAASAAVLGRPEHPADDDVEQVVRAVDAGEDHQQERGLTPERAQPSERGRSAVPRPRTPQPEDAQVPSSPLLRLESPRGGEPGCQSSHDDSERPKRPRQGIDRRLAARRRAPSRDLARVPALLHGRRVPAAGRHRVRAASRARASRVGGVRWRCCRRPASSCSGARSRADCTRPGRSSSPDSPRWSCCGGRPGMPAASAAFLGALNPWVYDRMVEGQWGVVVAAAGLFLWVAAWEALQASPGARRALVLALTGARSRCVRTSHARPHRSARARRKRCGLASGRTAAGCSGPAHRSRCWRVLLSYGAISFFLSDAAGRLRDGDAVHARRLRVLPFRLQRRLRAARQPGRAVRLLGRGHRPLPAREPGRLMVAGHQRGDRRRRARRGLAPARPGLAARLRAHRPRRERQHGVPGRPRRRRVARPSASRSPPPTASRRSGARSGCSRSSRSPPERSSRSPDSRAVGGRPLRAFAARPSHTSSSSARCCRRGSIRSDRVPSIVDPVEYPDYWYRTEAYLASAVPEDEPIVVLPWHLYQPLVASEGRSSRTRHASSSPGDLVVPQNLEIPGRFTDVTSRYDRIGAVIEREGHGSCAVGAGDPRRRREVGARARRDGGARGDRGAYGDAASRWLRGGQVRLRSSGGRGTKFDHSVRGHFGVLGTVGYTRAASTRGGKGKSNGKQDSLPSWRR